MKKADIIKELTEILDFLAETQDDLVYNECDCGSPSCQGSSLALPVLTELSMNELFGLHALPFVDDVRVESFVVPGEDESAPPRSVFSIFLLLDERIEDWDGEIQNQVIFDGTN